MIPTPSIPRPGTSRPGRRLAWPLALLAVTVGAAVTGCAHGAGVATGTALSIPSRTDFGIAALPPGAKMGVLNVAFYNTSSLPLTITKVTITGRGIGTIARVTEIKIAPAGHDPATAYVTDPPVYHFLHTSRLGPAGCDVQQLVPPRGYVVLPGNARGYHNLYIWAVVQMIRPGRYRSLGATVYYTQRGTRYKDFVTNGFDGTVTRSAAWPTSLAFSAGCLNKTHPLNASHP